MEEKRGGAGCIHTVHAAAVVCVLPKEQLMDLLLDCSHRLVPAVMAALNWNYVHTRTKRTTHNCNFSVCKHVCVCSRVGTSKCGASRRPFKPPWKDGWTAGQLKRRGRWDHSRSSRCSVNAFINDHFVRVSVKHYILGPLPQLFTFFKKNKGLSVYLIVISMKNGRNLFFFARLKRVGFLRDLLLDFYCSLYFSTQF